MSGKNPFLTYDESSANNMDNPSEAFAAFQVSSPEDQQRKEQTSQALPIGVSLPPHLFIPADAQSIDIRRLANIPPATTVTLLEFTGRRGTFTKFINYAIFNDALLFDLIEFVPTVNNVRIFPFHGDPQSGFKIGLGLGPDLSNANLIACQLDLQPGDVLRWTFTNNDVVDVAAGVRMMGYVDQSNIRKIGRFGG
jgi:hypothetical protein